MDEALALFSVQKQSPLSEGCSQPNLREDVLSRGCQVGSERRTLSECQPCLGHSSTSTLVPATWTHLQGFEAVLASNNQDPWPFLPAPFLDHLLVSSGSQAPEMTPGSNVRRAGLRGARGPCSTSGPQGLSQPHHSPHQPTGQTDLSGVSSRPTDGPARPLQADNLLGAQVLRDSKHPSWSQLSGRHRAHSNGAYSRGLCAASVSYTGD